MSEIKVTYDSHMGDCLKVCRMAKDSYGRTTDWVNGEYGNLSDKDQRLLKMLARGMGAEEYSALIDEIFEACDVLSSDAEIQSKATIERLMWKFRHTTPHLAPFGHNFVTFKFQAPVFVMRQIVKHEYIRISELSMRYVRGMPEYFRPKSWRAVAEDVKQGSGGEIADGYQWDNTLADLYQLDKSGYEWDLMKGLAPEQARMFLRLCHMTQGHLSGSMDAIAGLVTKRLYPHAQAETREFAKQIDKIMSGLYPWSWAALTEGVSRD